MSALVVLLGTFVSALALLVLADRILPGTFLGAAVNARSNHTAPARQIGGIGVVPAMVAGLAFALVAIDARLAMATAGAMAVLFVTGYLDDRHDLAALPKLGAQAGAALFFVLVLGPEFRLLPDLLPLAVERAGMALLLVWFVNMVNFMDGLDLMVVSGVGAPALVIALAGALALVDAPTAFAAALLAGPLAAFALFNRPPARMFLGDNGSLPIGFLAGVLTLLLARESLAAAVLPFAFFLCDSLSVLALRLMRRENVFAAHSGHAYQRARRAGLGVGRIALLVGLASAACAVLAVAAMARPSAAGLVLALAGLLVAAGLVLALRRHARLSGG